MSFENKRRKENAGRPHAFLEYGGAGHETEYVFTTQKNIGSETDELSWEIEDALEESLGEGWSIINRGHRIEITPPNSEKTPETESKLREAIKSFLGDSYIFPPTR